MKFSAKRTLLVGGLLLGASTSAFQPAVINQPDLLLLSANPNKITTTDDQNIGVTPNQIKALRKEASKRRARNQLVNVQFVPALDGNDEEVQKFLSDLGKELIENELVEVRGVCINKKPLVFSTSEQLAYDLSVELGRDVSVVQIQGYKVTLFCHSPDPSKRKIVLRTSYKDGAWSKREKAPRDHRGQIIKN